MSIHLLRRTGFMTKPGAGPGPEPGISFSDDFEGPPGQDLGDRTGWTKTVADGYVLQIDDTGTLLETQLATGVQHNFYATQTSEDPDNVRLTLRGCPNNSGSTWPWALVTRFIDFDNCIYLRYRVFNNYRFYQRINGTNNQFVSFTISPGDDVSIASPALDTIEIYVNDILFDSYTIPDPSLNSQSHGLMAESNSIDCSVADRFEIGTY